jgi:hypothetical protein
MEPNNIKKKKKYSNNVIAITSYRSLYIGRG